jgi:colicin import membrane protein
MSDAKAAEQLWIRAHERIKHGELAQAVRDLSKAYEILKGLRDPRIGQVHRRWVEVHKLYQERKAAGQAGPAAGAQAAAAKAKAEAEAKARAEAEAQARAAAEARKSAESKSQEVAVAEANYRKAEAERARAESAPMSIEQQAETAANEGDLQKAIALYRQVVSAQPNNELAQERVRELEAAAQKADELSRPQPAARQIDTSVPAGAPLDPGDTPASQVAYLEGLIQQVQGRRRA